MERLRRRREGLNGYRRCPYWNRCMPGRTQLPGGIEPTLCFPCARRRGALVLGALVLFKPPEMFTPWILIPCVGLTFVGILLMVWQPRWTRPPWLRRYQEDIRPRSADA